MSNLFCRSKMPILALKQQIKSSRFVSKNGKYTYYQNSSGKLLLSTNFNVKTVLQGQKNSNYHITSSPSRKKIIISQDLNPHNFLGLRKSHNLYLADFGDVVATSIGNGSNPQIHLNDSWLSYYQFQKKHIVFQHLKNVAIKFQIKIINTMNPYFVPNVVMLDEKTIIFTDINEKGIPGIIQFSRINNKIKLLFKGDDINKKIEICKGSKSLYLGVFSLAAKTSSTIYELPLANLSFGNLTKVYDSPHSDIGNILCNQDHLYFIKTIYSKNSAERSELALLKKTHVQIVSDLNNVRQVINMDGNILIPYQSNFYIVEGNYQLNKDALDNDK